jgi:hypothetical protein
MAAKLEIDFMEYSTPELAQAAYVTDAGEYASQYPTQDADHVKATTILDANCQPFYTTDPTKTLTGTDYGVSWLSENSGGAGVPPTVNQRFHIDLGSAQIIKRIYYENNHDSGTTTNHGVKNATFWGSNEASAFAELTYGIDTNWTQIGGALQFEQHTASDVADPKYIVVTNTTAYRYYAFKFPDNWGGTYKMGIRRIELQTLSPSLQSYSEATIKTQGSYALKAVAAITDSLNKTLTKTFSPSLDLSGVNFLQFDAYALRTGSQWKLGLHDTGGTTTEITPNIITSNTQQTIKFDLSAVSDANKDAIDTLTLTIINADSANTIYLDNFKIAQAIDVFGIVT